MKFSAQDRARLQALLALSEQNLRALELFSGYLNLCPRFVTAAEVRELTQTCQVPEETAYRLLVTAACGLDTEENTADRAMEQRYLRHAIHRLDAAACRRDPYYQTIRMPEKTLGGWRMGYKRLEPYEAFTSDDPLVLPDGREVPQVGYFDEVFDTPVVYENEREWMTVTPSEINTMTAHIRAAYGKVAVFGLGLGYYAFMASEKMDVREVTVIERDPNVIALFKEHILPQFSNGQKVRVVQADAYEYATHMAAEGYDVAYVDIWHDVLDGVEMYLKMKRLECRSPATRFYYWIEPSMLCWLRGMALLEIAEDTSGPMLQTIGSVETYDALLRRLSFDGLRALAPRIPLEVARR